MWDPDVTDTVLVMHLLVWLCCCDMLLLAESCDFISEKFPEAVSSGELPQEGSNDLLSTWYGPKTLAYLLFRSCC
jgi:hypothetical protein